MVTENRNDFNEIAKQLETVQRLLAPIKSIEPETVSITKNGFILAVAKLQQLKNLAEELALLYQNRSDRVESNDKAASEADKVQGEPMIPMSLAQWEIIRARIEDAQNSLEFAYHAMPNPEPDRSIKPKTVSIEDPRSPKERAKAAAYLAEYLRKRELAKAKAEAEKPEEGESTHDPT